MLGIKGRSFQISNEEKFLSYVCIYVWGLSVLSMQFSVASQRLGDKGYGINTKFVESWMALHEEWIGAGDFLVSRHIYDRCLVSLAES